VLCNDIGARVTLSQVTKKLGKRELFHFSLEVLFASMSTNPVLRLNDKYRPAAAPAVLQSAPFSAPASYSFSLEKQVLESSKHKHLSSRVVCVEVRFRDVSKTIKLPCQLLGSVLLEKMRAVCDARVEHMEVNGRVIAKLEDYVAFSENDLIVAAVDDGPEFVESDNDKIPCDKCGLPILASLYLEHEQSCK
jgi:hypothetical protein